MVQTAPSLGDRGSRIRWMNSVFRTEDRYLGRAVWEHYLGFEQHRTSSKAINLSMIRLGNQDLGEAAVLRPGARYAIFKITNGTMTAHKGLWSWTPQEVR